MRRTTVVLLVLVVTLFAVLYALAIQQGRGDSERRLGSRSTRVDVSAMIFGAVLFLSGYAMRDVFAGAARRREAAAQALTAGRR